VQLFISYSHNDADKRLARHLADRFREVGMSVWQDESSQPAGESLQADIEKAIRESDHAVFLVSKLWLQSRYCRLELDRFDRRDPSTVRRVPIFRLPPEQLMLPVQLIDLKGITWFDDDPHHDARFWEVYCAITGEDPGRSEDWGERGRALTKGSVPPPIGPPPRTTLDSLRCDRALQWTRIENVAPNPSHDLLIVPGEAGQAHDHFSRRVREMLTTLPPRAIVTVHWRKRPSSEDEFLTALAEGLGVSRDWLPREMAERMSDSNLVLLHPCLRARFVDARLVSYYTTWLPRIIDETKPRMKLKCIQPVEWPIEEGAFANMLTWLRVRRAPPEDGRREAEQFIEQVRSSAAGILHANRLQDLRDISEADLNEFCEDERLTASQKAWFLSRIKSRNPTNAQEVFDAIDAFLADARSMT
jgi:TIR domain-containing protein